MKLVSIGWTAQSEIAVRLAHFRPLAPELYAGQNQATGEQIAALCAALNHPETDAAILIAGPRTEVFAAVEPLRRQLQSQEERSAAG